MVSLPPEQMEYYEWLQNEVNNGHQPWRIVPEQVVSDFLINHLNIEAGPKPLAKKVLRNGLEFTLSNEENHLSIFLFQPVTKGDFGIWTVAYYVDHTTGETHFVDLSQDIPIKIHRCILGHVRLFQGHLRGRKGILFMEAFPFFQLNRISGYIYDSY